MRVLCNRYNPAKLINFMEPIGSRMSYVARWQVSVADNIERTYDYFFVAKPTRKQIRKLHKGTK